MFNFAAFGDSSVTLGGNGSTDSYNSPTGLWRNNIASNGDVGTNGDDEGAVTINGENAQVNGGASTGPDGTIEGKENVTGQRPTIIMSSFLKSAYSVRAFRAFRGRGKEIKQ